jgi:hypothetical protein
LEESNKGLRGEDYSEKTIPPKPKEMRFVSDLMVD